MNFFILLFVFVLACCHAYALECRGPVQINEETNEMFCVVAVQKFNATTSSVSVAPYKGNICLNIKWAGGYCFPIDLEAVSTPVTSSMPSDVTIVDEKYKVQQ